MGYVHISKIYDEILIHINEEILSEDIVKGCQNSILDYIKRVAPGNIKEENSDIYVDKKILDEQFYNDYLIKNRYDCSAKDCAHIALNRVGVPPVDEMSLESLEKTIRALFREKKGKVYIKRSKGKGSTICVDLNTADDIVRHPDVISLIEKQIDKAERKHNNTVEWRAYEFEKKKIASIESSCTDNNDTGYSSRTLSVNEKTYLMVEAIYRKLFSDFDYAKYEKYCDEMDTLYDNWDFGERYQELYDIFNSQNYRNEFYEFKLQDDVLDILAEKIVNKLNEKRS